MAKAAYKREWRKHNHARIRVVEKAYTNRKWAEVRSRILDLYGRECNLCGNTEQQLVLDHKNNDGYAHRQMMPNLHVYTQVLQDKYPQDRMQLLCRGCHSRKHPKGSSRGYTRLQK